MLLQLPDIALIRIELVATTNTVFVAPAVQALHGAVHQLATQHDAVLGHLIHSAQEKLVSISPLIATISGTPVGRQVAAGTRASATIATLIPNVTHGMLQAVAHAHMAGTPLNLDGSQWRLTTWSQVAPANALVWHRTHGEIQAAQPAHNIKVFFDSPTVFRRGGRHIYHPGAHQVFGGYLRRWNALVRLPLGIDLPEIDSCVTLVDNQIHQVEVDLGIATHPGFVGWAQYEIEDNDVLASAIGSLIAFAPYCGTGARTAWGMGQTRVHTLDPRTR